MDKLVRGAGGSSDAEEPHIPVEAPDSLHSVAYAHILDLVSEGEIVGFADQAKPLTCMFLNETPIANDDGTLNFQNVHIDSRVGTQTQDYIVGFDSTENEIGVSVELGTSPVWTRSVTNLNLTALRVLLSTPALSQTDTSTGDINGYSVAYKIELSTDGGAYVSKLIGALTGKTTSKYERSHHIDLPKATSGWTIKVTRLTAKSSASAIQDSMYVESYTEIIAAKLRMPMSALVSTVVDAKQFNNIPSRAFRMKGRIIRVPTNYDPVTRTYVGIWDGTFKLAYCNNPAWVFYDLATNARYGLGHLVSDALVDKWALYKISKYCDGYVSDGTLPRATISTGPMTLGVNNVGTNRFTRLTGSFITDGYVVGDFVHSSGFSDTVNNDTFEVIAVSALQLTVLPRTNAMVYDSASSAAKLTLVGAQEPRFTANLYLQQQADALRVMQDIATIFRGIMYSAGGAIVAAGDMPDDPIYTFSPANVLKGQFVYQGSSKKVRHTVAHVSWNDMSDFGRAKIEYVEDFQGIARYGVQTTEVIAMGCTSQGQAHRLGRYVLATERYETDAVAFGVGLEGTIPVPGRVILIADPLRAGRRTGGRVRAASNLWIEVDALPIVSVGDQFWATMPNGTIEQRTVSAITGGNRIATAVPFSAVPVAHSMWIVESSSVAAQRFRVIGVTEIADGSGYNINAIQHVEGKYEFVENGTPINEPPITANMFLPAPTPVTLANHVRAASGGAYNVLSADWPNVKGATHYDIKWRKDNGPWSATIRQSESRAEWEGAFAGTYNCKVWAVDPRGFSSPVTNAGPITIGEATMPVLDLGIETDGSVIVDCIYSHFRLRLTRNAKIKFINVAPQDTIIMEVTQTGAFTLDFPASVHPADGKPYVATTVVGGTDKLGLDTNDEGFIWIMTKAQAGSSLKVVIAPTSATASATTDGTTGSSPSTTPVATASGGSGPYTHKWTRTDTGGGTNFTISSTTAANPTFSIPSGTTAYDATQTWRDTVTDANGYVAFAAFTVRMKRTVTVGGGGSAFTIALSPSGSAYGYCDTASGACSPHVAVTATPTGATGTVTYAWTRVDTAGTPNFTVAGGTTATATFSKPSATIPIDHVQTWRCTATNGSYTDHEDIVIELERNNSSL